MWSGRIVTIAEVHALHDHNRMHLENMPRGRMRERERERESTIFLDEIVAISAAAFIMRNGRHFFLLCFKVGTKKSKNLGKVED